MLNQMLTDSTEAERWSEFNARIGAHPDLGDHFLLHAAQLQHGTASLAREQLDSLEVIALKDVVVLEVLSDLRDSLAAEWPYARPQDWAALEPQIDRLEPGAAWARAMAHQATHTRELPLLPLPDPNKSRVLERRRQGPTDDVAAPGARLFPNPATDHTFIILDEVSQGGITYRLTDGAGRTVLEEGTLISGQVFQVDLNGLAAGIYACEVNGLDGLVRTLQLVVTD